MLSLWLDDEREDAVPEAPQLRSLSVESASWLKGNPRRRPDMRDLDADMSARTRKSSKSRSAFIDAGLGIRVLGGRSSIPLPVIGGKSSH